MKILILLPEAPAPFGNTAASWYAPLVKWLALRGHQVTCLAVCTVPSHGREALDYLSGLSVDLRFFAPPAVSPLYVRKLRSTWRPGWELARSAFGDTARLELAHDGYDVALAEMPSTGWVIAGESRAVLSIHHYSHVDASIEPWWRLGRLKTRLQERRVECSVVRRFQTIRVTSSRLRGLTALLNPKATVDLVPVCIDPVLYEPVRAPEKPVVGVIGSMHWTPSRIAAERLINSLAPAIRKQVPGVRFLVAGWNARSILGPLVTASDIDLEENFPSRREVFARLSVLLYAPPLGTGMKAKVLEAFAYGVPLVVNTEGAEGLDVASVSPVVLGETDEELVERTVLLLRDSVAAERQVSLARDILMQYFSPEVTVSQLEVVLDRVAGGTR